MSVGNPKANGADGQRLVVSFDGASRRQAKRSHGMSAAPSFNLAQRSLLPNCAGRRLSRWALSTTRASDDLIENQGLGVLERDRGGVYCCAVANMPLQLRSIRTCFCIAPSSTVLLRSAKSDVSISATRVERVYLAGSDAFLDCLKVTQVQFRGSVSLAREESRRLIRSNIGRGLARPKRDVVWQDDFARLRDLSVCMDA